MDLQWWPHETNKAWIRPFKNAYKPCEYCKFRHIGLHVASLELLTSTSVWIKNKQMCIFKYQKSPREAQFWQARNAFGPTHSDSERESLLFFWFAKTSKSMISLSDGLWKVLFCNIAQTEPQNCTSKTSIKPVQYCSFAQKGLKMALMRFCILCCMICVLCFAFWMLYVVCCML